MKFFREHPETRPSAVERDIRRLFAVPSAADRIDNLNRTRFQAGQACRAGAITPNALKMVHVDCTAKEPSLGKRRQSAFELWMNQRSAQ
jgi:hypothetical protein